VAYALAMQEVARACASTAVTMAVTNMVGEVIATFGTDAQKKHYNPKLASGEYAAGAFALSEPEAGSDPGGMRTTAVRDGDDWVIDGQKQWITSGAHAGVFVVWARTGGPGTKGISCFLVEGGAPGLKAGKHEDKLGLRASNTVPLTFEDCLVPHDALFGELDGGFKIAMMALDGGRIGISAQAIDVARAALAESMAYAKDRKQFDKPIADFQAIQFMLADMAADIEAARLLTYKSAWLLDSGQRNTLVSSYAKRFAADMGMKAATDAVQIFGGYGYTKDFPVEKFYRDSKLCTIGEGTSEIQKLVIGREILR